MELKYLDPCQQNFIVLVKFLRRARSSVHRLESAQTRYHVPMKTLLLVHSAAIFWVPYAWSENPTILVGFPCQVVPLLPRRILYLGTFPHESLLSRQRLVDVLRCVWICVLWGLLIAQSWFLWSRGSFDASRQSKHHSSMIRKVDEVTEVLRKRNWRGIFERRPYEWLNITKGLFPGDFS